MAEYPLLPLPPSEPGEPPDPPGFPQRGPGLSPQRQGQRLGPEFKRLQTVLASDERGLSLRADPSSIAPERALVFEVARSIKDFYQLVTKTQGFEFLADEETVFDPDEDFFEVDTRTGREGLPRTDRPMGGSLYLAMPDVGALRELLRLWDIWRTEGALPRGHTPWRDIFACLRDVRPWGPADRITDEAIEFWREGLGAESSEPLRIEAELWFYDSAERRAAAYRRMEEAVTGAGGSIIHHAIIEDIRYEAALIDLPGSEVARLVAREEIHLAICDDVMFLRPQSSLDVPERGDETESGTALAAEPPDDRPPIAALLDGIPVQNHQLLDGRLDVDDPDDLEAMSVLSERHHGTAIASLILHGDRNLGEPPISRRLHLRPVLYAPGNGNDEAPKRDRLLVDVIYRAIRRMKEGDGDGEATAPEVFLVNLSLGDPRRPFSGPMSPWAKLLDHLAEHYRILFLVSAGNVTLSLPLSEFTDWTSFENADSEDREHAVLQALADNRAYRTLLSPAEALNVVTVGAWHDDALDGPRGAMAVDPYPDGDLPNVSSAQGLGHRRVIKPDVHLPGGREQVSFRAIGETLIVVPGGRYGLKAAAPSADGKRDREYLSKGTSAATALATRAAHRIFDSLMDTDGGSLHGDLDPRYYAVVTKAMLVHRAKWGSRADVLDQFYGPRRQGQHGARRDNIARLLGYGFPDIDEAVACTPHRATLLGYGRISAKEAKVHRIPLPPSLERITEPRKVTVTVAWLSPVNPRHQVYRRAKLEVGAVTKLETAAGVKRSSGQPLHATASRGAVFHARYEGERAVSFVDDGYVLLRIFCREQAGALDQSIRYGVAVTIEAGEGIAVYDEIRTRLGLPVVARTP